MAAEVAASENRDSTSMRAIKGVIALAGVMLVWLVILPRLSDVSVIRKHVETMRANGVEASAKFYTELNWTPPTGPVWR